MNIDEHIDKIIATQEKIENQGVQNLDATTTVMTAMLMHSIEKLADELIEILKNLAQEDQEDQATESVKPILRPQSSTWPATMNTLNEYIDECRRNYRITKLDGSCFLCEMQIQDGMERWREGTKKEAIESIIDAARNINHVSITADDICFGEKGN